jgi:hypothetical protein
VDLWNAVMVAASSGYVLLERENTRGSGILILYERCCMFYDTATNNFLCKFGFFNFILYFLIISLFDYFFLILFKILFTKKLLVNLL